MSTKKNKRAKRSKNPRAVIKKVDYIGLNHAVVNEKMNPNVKFINYMSIKGLNGSGRFVAGVYFDPKPNKELNHSDYLLIHTVFDPFIMERKIYVTGRSAEQMEENRFHHGILCLECNTVLISLSGHHYHGCGCDNDVHVDGGQCKWGGLKSAKDFSKTLPVRVDMLTDKIYVRKKNA